MVSSPVLPWTTCLPPSAKRHTSSARQREPYSAFPSRRQRASPSSSSLSSLSSPLSRTAARVPVGAVSRRRSPGLPARHSVAMADLLVEGEAPQAHRKRVPMACTRCRQRKIRCSGNKGDGRPCMSCAASNQEQCIYNRVQSIEALWRPDNDAPVCANAAAAASAPAQYHASSGFDYSLSQARSMATRSSMVASGAYGADMGTHGHAMLSYRAPYQQTQGYYPQYAGQGGHGYDYGVHQQVGLVPSPWATRRQGTYGAHVAGDVFADVQHMQTGYGSAQPLHPHPPMHPAPPLPGNRTSTMRDTLSSAVRSPASTGMRPLLSGMAHQSPPAPSSRSSACYDPKPDLGPGSDAYGYGAYPSSLSSRGSASSGATSDSSAAMAPSYEYPVPPHYGH